MSTVRKSLYGPIEKCKRLSSEKIRTESFIIPKLLMLNMKHKKDYNTGLFIRANMTGLPCVKEPKHSSIMKSLFMSFARSGMANHVIASNASTVLYHVFEDH